MTLAIVYTASGRRSAAVADAMAAGMKRCGVKVVRRTEAQYRGPEGDVAVFYGLEGKLLRALGDYPAEGGTAVHLDLGIWQRHAGGRYRGFHRVAVNGRWSQPHLSGIRRGPERLRRLGVAVEPWRHAPHGRILLAGMGEKAALHVGHAAEAWERRAIAAIRGVTARRIVYRPKPSWLGARPIEDVDYEAPVRDIDWRDTWCLVTHHSNAAVEAIAAGVPAIVAEGPAAEMALRDPARVEWPWRPDGRAQWLQDLAWWQWDIAEMGEGSCWRWLRDEGLVPA